MTHDSILGKFFGEHMMHEREQVFIGKQDVLDGATVLTPYIQQYEHERPCVIS